MSRPTAHISSRNRQLILIFCSFLIAWTSFSQRSEALIPKDASTVFSINNFSLLQKISIDDLVKYEFMEEVQQELFDGSTSGKTLKDSGIDFDQKLNVFYGKEDAFEISGFTFGVKDKQKLFSVFDDFALVESPYEGVEYYTSYFNSLLIQGSSALLIRVEPSMENVDAVTDSIWFSRGNRNPFEQFDTYEESLEESEDEFLNELQNEEETEESDPLDMETLTGEDDLEQKNYYELRDSVQMELQATLMERVCNELLIRKINLVTFDNRFAEQLTHSSEAVFYLDNARSLQNAQGLWYFETMFPSLYQDIKELYSGNVMLGDLMLHQNSVEFVMNARYGPELGSIYEEMNDARFDKQVLKYINKNNTAYFTYNIDMRQAYEQAYKVIMPILSDERNLRISTNVLTLELLNEFVDKDALFNTYKGSMFGTFGGIKKIKTTKIDFSYDEETFEYLEKEVDAEEDMPVFTLGFTTERSDIPEKVLKHLSRMTSRFQNKGNYWVYEDAILEAAPLYMINRNGLFIFTNDEDLVVNHADGYGEEALHGKEAKKCMKSGFMYGKIDWSNTIEKFPRDFFSEKQNQVLDAMRGKTGSMELTTSETTKEGTRFDLVYYFEGSYENSGKYLLDLLNSIYVMSK
jgi:hypothetical protein